MFYFLYTFLPLQPYRILALVRSLVLLDDGCIHCFIVDETQLSLLSPKNHFLLRFLIRNWPLFITSHFFRPPFIFVVFLALRFVFYSLTVCVCFIWRIFYMFRSLLMIIVDSIDKKKCVHRYRASHTRQKGKEWKWKENRKKQGAK